MPTGVEARLPVTGPRVPAVERLAGELAGYDGERELDEGLDVILAACVGG
jgi:hypothetical protein